MRSVLGIVGALWAMAQATAQTPFPDHVIGNVTWNNGTHHTALAQPILSPGSPGAPIDITGTADAEFVSGTQVRLADGFHAGNFSGAGQFHAYIDDALGQPDLVVIAPDPSTFISGNVLNVHKWEKMELGLQLPQEYHDAISSFFANYYSNGPSAPATPGQLDRDHDLNPYADDSLLLIMTLISPSNVERMKWGFYMNEATWANTTPPAEALLAPNPGSPLHPYNIRFRFAPDEEGLWQFSLSIKAPYTSTPVNYPLPDLLYTGYSFVCAAPLPDNHGYLRVNQTNKRLLQFQDGTSFFGLGTNMADIHRKNSDHFEQRDFDVMKLSMEQLHAVGGNFMRMYLKREIFAPEWMNLGVYDHYYAPHPCSGNGVARQGNGQHQSWAFDQMLDHARENNIYVQLCIDPYGPVFGNESSIWGNHAYYVHFLEPNPYPPEAVPGNRFDINSFFFEGGDPANTGDGTVFYYWKRKYKYILARWGYSVNIAALEPFNEMEHLLTYRYHDLTSGSTVCPDNKLIWESDPDLPVVMRDWFTELANYVRGTVNTSDPAYSPMGDERQLFVASFGNSDPGMQGAEDYYLPLTSEGVDLMDAHKYVGGYLGAQNQPDSDMESAFDDVQRFRTSFPDPDPNIPRKPFNQGETNYSNVIGVPGWSGCEIQKLFHNYDVSFHNEIWAGAFMGKFTTGTTWHWERVFWWKDALPKPHDDPDNFFQQLDFSNVLGVSNPIDIGTALIPVEKDIENRTLHHHFRPLTDFLANPNFPALGFFDGEYTAHRVQPGLDLDWEAYYLMNEDQNAAIGWVHNARAYWNNNWYATETKNNLFGCTLPPSDPSDIQIPGFDTGTDYYVSWFPTRMNTTVCPVDYQWPGNAGSVYLQFGSGDFNDIANNWLDTLHSDFAFVIAPYSVKIGSPATVTDSADAEPDFDLYPNPAREVVFVRTLAGTIKHLVLTDALGRRRSAIQSSDRAVEMLQLEGLASGLYFVHVNDGGHTMIKKLIIR